MGRHHSGIDDTINITKLFLAAAEKGFTLNQNFVDGNTYESGSLQSFLEELKSADASSLPIYTPPEGILEMVYGYEEEKSESQEEVKVSAGEHSEKSYSKLCFIKTNKSEDLLDSQFECILTTSDKELISH